MVFEAVVEVKVLMLEARKCFEFNLTFQDHLLSLNWLDFDVKKKLNDQSTKMNFGQSSNFRISYSIINYLTFHYFRIGVTALDIYFMDHHSSCLLV